jgi:hypothetical protein
MSLSVRLTGSKEEIEQVLTALKTQAIGGKPTANTTHSGEKAVSFPTT